jgi:hypothetical protein
MWGLKFPKGFRTYTRYDTSLYNAFDWEAKNNNESLKSKKDWRISIEASISEKWLILLFEREWSLKCYE